MSSSLPPNDPNVPELNDIITQITNNGEFKNIMENISEGLAKTNGEADKVEANNTSNEQLEDLMCTYFADNEGNSISDILTSINNNLTKIVEKLSSN